MSTSEPEPVAVAAAVNVAVNVNVNVDGLRCVSPPRLTSTHWPARIGRLATFVRARSTNTPPRSITARALRRDKPAMWRGIT